MPGGPSGPAVILASDSRARGSPEQAGQVSAGFDFHKEDCERAIVGDSWGLHMHVQTQTCTNTPNTKTQSLTHTERKGF